MNNPGDKRNILSQIVVAQKRGEAKGIYSICSANQFVIEAGIKQALETGIPLLIESTSNQVNQYGGYMGMIPKQFAEYVWSIADEFHFPRENIILGGDHLGPNVWRNEPVERAMQKSRQLVQDCVLAGYTKIHLDASMRCADDPVEHPLEKSISAERAAELCEATEMALAKFEKNSAKVRYVIGTEVPPPGGLYAGSREPAVTKVEDVEQTIELTKKAFMKRGLERAWERVIAIVVQPGIEFGDDRLFEYDHNKAIPLSHFIESYEQLIYEAHSTDYQTRETLKRLVEDHFAVLKVGPALTFAFREAIFALAMIEAEWLPTKPGTTISNVRGILEEVMLETPIHWKNYYSGEEDTLRFARAFSFSDRSRYYWPHQKVQKSLQLLLANLKENPIPLSLLSQFLPEQYDKVRSGVLPNTPRALIHDKIMKVTSDYTLCMWTRGKSIVAAKKSSIPRHT